MERAIKQSQAKVMIRDYLRETGRKGVTSLIREINKQAKQQIFEQRTLEKWLIDENRHLQDRNWEIVLNFIQSPIFKQFVLYANEEHPESRLIRVGDGLTALYTDQNTQKIGGLSTEQYEQAGQEAIKLLEGFWRYYWPEKKPFYKRPALDSASCTIIPVPEKRYAKFFFVATLSFHKFTASGLAIYINSELDEIYDYYHNFILHLWFRKDPNTGFTVPARLTYLKETEDQPEFSMPKIGNAVYGTRDEGLAFQLNGKLNHPSPGESDLIDLMLEDCLPHGLT